MFGVLRLKVISIKDVRGNIEHNECTQGKVNAWSCEGENETHKIKMYTHKGNKNLMHTWLYFLRFPSEVRGRCTLGSTRRDEPRSSEDLGV